MPGMPGMPNPVAMMGSGADPLAIPIDPATALTAATRAAHGDIDLDALFPNEPPLMPKMQLDAARRQYYFLATSPAMGTYYFMAPAVPVAADPPDVPVPDPGPDFGLGG